MRLFLTEAGYGKALENQDKGFIKIKNHAKVIAGNLRYDQKTVSCRGIPKTLSKRVENPLFFPCELRAARGMDVFPCGGYRRNTDGRNAENQHFSNHEEGGIRYGGFPHRKDP